MQDSLKLHVMISLAKPKHVLIQSFQSICSIVCHALHLFKNEESKKKKKYSKSACALSTDRSFSSLSRVEFVSDSNHCTHNYHV